MFKFHVNYMSRFPVFFLFLQHYYENTLGQTQTIIFAQSTQTQSQLMPTTPQTRTCTCVPPGACTTNTPAPTAGGIDIRIVNPGSLTCTTGLQVCCTGTGGNSSGMIDASCGIRKIALTAQPTGTASYGAYPWQAALLTTANNYIGSGVLLDARHILTVAHKVAPYANTINALKVRLGDWNGQAVTEMYPYQDYNLQLMAIHPQFNAENLQNDVAVIRLAGTVPVATSPGVSTICPPTSVPAVGTRCWVSGWGQNAFGPSGAYQNIMKEVDVPILDQNDCETRLRGTRLGQFFTLNRSSFICAGGEANKDACTGDGGSPLVCQVGGRWQVVGLVAWGIGCATAGVPGVYVNIPNYLAWILQQIASA